MSGNTANMKEKLKEKLKLLLDIPEEDTSKDSLLALLLEDAESYLLSYCRLSEVPSEAESLTVKMAAEDYGRRGGEGVSYRTVSGASESYRGDYSPVVMSALRRHRRLGAVECS